MKKIRIGNDIRIQTVLTELNEYDQSSIKQLRCYIIRKCDLKYVDLTNFGYPQYYCPTEYDINLSGIPRYNYFPYNGYVFNGGMFGPVDDYKLFPSYNGFGVRSRQFKLTAKEYLAPSRILSGKGAIELYFPAQDQKNLGMYKVVIVVTVYQYGWGSNNLRTYTIDKGDLFELVCDSTGQSGNIIIDTEQSRVHDITINSPLYICAGDSLGLLDADAVGKMYRILVNTSDGEQHDWSEEYKEIVPIQYSGNIIVNAEDGTIQTNNSDTDYAATITVGTEDIAKSIQINVKANPKIYINLNGTQNSITNVKYNSAYTKVLDSSYGSITLVNISHDGVDITDTVYNSTDKIINIPHVTGAVVINIASQTSIIPEGLTKYTYDNNGTTAEYAVQKYLDFEYIGFSGVYPEGVAAYDKYAFCHYNGNAAVNITDLSTKQTVKNLYNSPDWKEHCGTVSFGKELAPDSQFPYLYVSMQHADKHCVNVYKITGTAPEFNRELVQIITLPAPGSITHYYGDATVGDGCLWATGFTEPYYKADLSETNKLKFVKYRLPAVSEGNVSVTPIDSFEAPMISVTQGSIIRNGKLYLPFGFGNDERYPGKLCVYDLDLKKKIVDIDFTESLNGYEPQGVLEYNGHLYVVVTRYNVQTLELYRIYSEL